MTTPTPTPKPPSGVELLRRVLNSLLADVAGRVAWGGIAMALNVFISARLIGHRQQIERIVARIRAGTYKPRRRSPAQGAPPPPASRPPRPPGPVKQGFGWLLPLLPPYWNANGYSAALESVLADPDMVALIQAAPVTLGRPLRSLCWMLRVRPPPVLAPPRRTAPRPATPPPAKPKAKPQRPAPLPARPPTRPDAPAWMQNWPPPVRGSRKFS